MCSTSKFCNQVADVPCALSKKGTKFLETFQRHSTIRSPSDGAFFLKLAETIQFSRRGEPCSSYLCRIFIPASRPVIKKEAIRQVAAALVSAGNVADGYVNGMLAREQQTSTFLGNGIAIPHGTTDTRDQVLKTGVQVFQFPQGVTWGEGQTAYVAIGIAASSDEHLGLLRQLTHVLSDDAVAAQLQSATTAEELRALLMGEKQSEALKLDNETLSLDVAASDLLTLQALERGATERSGCR